MRSEVLFSITTGIYIVCFLLFLVAHVFRQGRLNKPVVWLLTAGFGIQTVGFVLRLVEFHRLMKATNPEPLPWTSLYQFFPVTNLYESLVLFAWTSVLVFLWLYWKRGLIELGWLVALLTTAAMAYASGLAAPQRGVAPLVPALKSNWLLFHVITCFLAYAAFGVAAALAGLVLIRGGASGSARAEPRGLGGWGPHPPKADGAAIPPIKEAPRLDHVMYRIVLFGFLLLTIGIILGAVWANASWGSYWSWDPKETWSLITWFVYAGFLHARRTRGWVGRPAAALALIGFAVTLFCYLGVNLVLSGLHSYGSE